MPDRWRLCDGTGGTPDWRDKFILGVGDNTTVGQTGGSAAITIAVANLPPHTHEMGQSGEHTHLGTTSENGGHAHQASSSPAGAHDHGGELTGGTHRHEVPSSTATGTTGVQEGGSTSSVETELDGGHAHEVPEEPDHTHNITIQTSGVHNHIINVVANGLHRHSLAETGGGEPVNIMPPYYVAAYIMFMG